MPGKCKHLVSAFTGAIVPSYWNKPRMTSPHFTIRPQSWKSSTDGEKPSYAAWWSDVEFQLYLWSLHQCWKICFSLSLSHVLSLSLRHCWVFALWPTPLGIKPKIKNDKAFRPFRIRCLPCNSHKMTSTLMCFSSVGLKMHLEAHNTSLEMLWKNIINGFKLKVCGLWASKPASERQVWC